MSTLHRTQESWVRTLRLAFQCVGILYADLGTSPLYVYANDDGDGKYAQVHANGL